MQTYKINFDYINNKHSLHNSKEDAENDKVDQTGGAQNVYDMIEKSLNKSKIKEPFVAAKQRSTCKSINNDEVKLSCESGKILKYLLRMEIKSIERCNKTNKTNKTDDKNKTNKCISKIIRTDEASGKLYIDTVYLTGIVDNIVKFSKSLESKLNECRLMRTIDMVSLSKILLEEYSIDDKGEMVPKSSEEREKTIIENKKKEIILTPQNIMMAKGNILGTITKSISTPEDKDNIKLLIAVVTVVALFELSKQAPVAGQVVVGILAVVAIGVIASRVRTNKIFGSSVMPKDVYVKKLQIFNDVLTNFQKEINENKYKFNATYNVQQPQLNNATAPTPITSDNGKLYISSFCVTSVKSNCKKVVETTVNGVTTKVVSKIDPSAKQFVKGMLKYMEKVFDTFVSVDETKIGANPVGTLIDAEELENAEADKADAQRDDSDKSEE